MTSIFISLRTLPDEKRYILISKSDYGKNQRSAIYKRYLSIFYIRVSQIYMGYECLTLAVNKLSKLTNKN